MALKSYTGHGDSGHSSLGDGARHPKGHAAFEALGSIDELASVLALAEADGLPRDEALGRIQRDLFEAGGVLSGAVKSPAPSSPAESPFDFPAKLARLSRETDQLDAQLPPLRHFILPGGCPLAARLHHARAVCRRAERRLESSDLPTKAAVGAYLNRLSSYLFARARLENQKAGVPERVWARDG